MDSPELSCFHCGEPVPHDTDFKLILESQAHSMCCAGCLAVAELINASGHSRYYRFREALSRKVGDDVERLAKAWQSIDTKQKLWGLPDGDGRYDLILQTEGINCAACAWLIRSELAKIPAVIEVQVDVSSGFTRILWRPEDTKLSDIAKRLLRLGYKPHLPIAEEQERARQNERNASLKRVGVAGLGMMQVMMYAVGLYAGDAQGMSIAAERFLQWVSLLVTTPVLIYSGRVFIEGAIAGLKAGRPGMDVPVALAITGAYLASCINFFSGQGEVWFDSVVMFIFFLSLGRHVEMSLRHRNQQSGTALARLLPEWAEIVVEGGTQTVSIDELKPGDLLRVHVGDAFPADGVLQQGSTNVNEALLTGESQAIARQVGDKVIAGSINITQPVDMEVLSSGENSTISSLGRLLHRARSMRCRSSDLAERYASYFVIGVLLVAGLTFTWWFIADRTQVLAVTLSVLVVSCPCAFSLASPAVSAAASRALLKRGIILTHSSALEVLAGIKQVIFDKTGTLTTGETTVECITVNPGRNSLAREELLNIAGSLEQFSSHPLSRAFRTVQKSYPVENIITEQGGGISGSIHGTVYRIGQDTVSPGAHRLVKRLQNAAIPVTVISGDSEGAVSFVAGQLGIKHWYARQTPEMKLERLAELPKGVLMIGDGVNDAPVLAAADVSVAVHGGTEMANAAADFILTGASIDLVWEARRIALAARQIIRQNLAWAIMYNITMIPLAVTGQLKPWMAALGMSASSLLVVLNAARVGRSTGNGPSLNIGTTAESIKT
jgi:Cu2+-exporting ATPase